MKFFKSQFVLMCALSLCFFGCAGDAYLKAKDGFLIGYEYEEVPQAKGTAVLLHGLGSSLGEWYTFKKDLLRSGWSVMAIDLRGHGVSNWYKGEPVNWNNFSEEGFRGSLMDVEAAVKYVEPSKNLWLVGSSFGANLAVTYAASHDDVEGVVLLTPGTWYAGIMAEPSLETYTGPVMSVAAEDDGGAASIATSIGTLGPGERHVVILKEGGHGAVMLDADEKVRKEIIEWMNQHSR